MNKLISVFVFCFFLVPSFSFAESDSKPLFKIETKEQVIAKRDCFYMLDETNNK